MRTDSASVAVAADSETQAARAASLAADLELTLCPARTDPRHFDQADVLLLVTDAGLAVQATGRKAPGAVRVDFADPALRHRRRGGHNELLGKAVGVGRREELSIIDATAGLGRDAFVLADLGCKVQLCERNALIHSLLADGLTRALESDDAWLRQVAARMQLRQGEAAGLVLGDGDCDVICLDPMFPQRDKSAAVKKEMALFQRLLGTAPADGEALLGWALAQPVARVVVKRPPKAPYLDGLEPSHAIKGKSVRYDVHVLRGLS